MASKVKTPDEYIESLPDERKAVIKKLREILLKNLPKGFTEEMGEMLQYVVPYSLYPAGYHCNPKQPLPFMYLASQKGFVAIYHMGIYADFNLNKWFTEKYLEQCKSKPDMGKSCIRFKKLDKIPYDLIGELASKMSTKQWIEIYEKQFKK